MFNRNYKVFIATLISTLFLTSLVFADPTDGCELDTNELFLTSDGAVLYNSDVGIAGFQFTVDGATASGASGGDAAAAGFTVSAGGSTVLGFSFSGATVPAGCGTLTNLTLSGTATGLSNITVSDSAAQSVPFTYWEDDGGSGGDWDGDACSMPANTLHLSDAGSVLYLSLIHI